LNRSNYLLPAELKEEPAWQLGLSGKQEANMVETDNFYIKKRNITITHHD